MCLWRLSQWAKTALRSWPAPPPVSDNPAADCIGVVNDAAEFALWLSAHILENTIRVLRERADWSKEDAEAFGRILMRLAVHGGGGTLVLAGTLTASADTIDAVDVAAIEAPNAGELSGRMTFAIRVLDSRRLG
jgi:hypothetical protein